MSKENIACRIFKEQIDLINQLPEEDRAKVLYAAVNHAFNQIDNQNENQIDNQNENQIDNQNENAYISVSVSSISEYVLKLLCKNIVCKEFSSNYGGKRIGAGKKPQKTNKKISDTGIRTESNIIKSNIIENKGGVGGKETIDPEKKKRKVEQFEAMIQQLGQITKRKPNETVITYNEVRMPETLKQFIKQKFRPDTRKRAYDWMIDHVAGQQWNEDRIIKLLCKFESANVPETRAEYIQFVSKTNRPISCMAQKTA